MKANFLIVTTVFSLTLSPVHGAPDPAKTGLETSLSRDSEVVVAKARSLVLPWVEFREASLREAVAYLAEQGRQIDAGGTGINVNIELHNTSAPPNAHPPPIPLITLSLRSVTFLQAVTATAQQAGLSVRAESYGLVIYRKSNEGRRATASHRSVQKFADPKR